MNLLNIMLLVFSSLGTAIALCFMQGKWIGVWTLTYVSCSVLFFFSMVTALAIVLDLKKK